jgi:hypothetical protein
MVSFAKLLRIRQGIGKKYKNIGLEKFLLSIEWGNLPTDVQENYYSWIMDGFQCNFQKNGNEVFIRYFAWELHQLVLKQPFFSRISNTNLSKILIMNIWGSNSLNLKLVGMIFDLDENFTN